MGQNAKKFLKKGNSKRGLVNFLGESLRSQDRYGTTDQRSAVLK